MNARAQAIEVALPTVEFTLDQQTVHAFEGETILKAAERHGVRIPRLCHQDGLRPDGNCRACVVEIAGERTLAPSCCRSVTAGMAVQAKSERAVKSQKMVLEMLLSDMPDAATNGLKRMSRCSTANSVTGLPEWVSPFALNSRHCVATSPKPTGPIPRWR